MTADTYWQTLPIGSRARSRTAFADAVSMVLLVPGRAAPGEVAQTVRVERSIMARYHFHGKHRQVRPWAKSHRVLR